MKFSMMIRIEDGEWVNLESLPKEQSRQLINEIWTGLWVYRIQEKQKGKGRLRGPGKDRLWITECM